MLEDQQIIELFFAREEQAITELAAKYGSICLSIAKNILKSEPDAEECVNDTYLAVWNTVPPQKPNPLRTYVFRILRNISIAKYHTNTASKRNSQYDVALEELENCLCGISVEQEIAADELTRQIDRFLDSQGYENRMMFVRRYWYSDSIGEIAVRFGTNQNAVSVRLSRMREKLKKHLRKEGFEV